MRDASGAGADTAEAMLQPLAAVRAAGPARLEVAWADGTTMFVDLAAVLEASLPLAPLRDPAVFAQARLGAEGFDVQWPGGIELAGDQLWRWGREQAGELMSAALFRAWRGRHNLSQNQAARTLGLSLRMIKYYESGEKPIPKTIRLACIGASVELASR